MSKVKDQSHNTIFSGKMTIARSKAISSRLEKLESPKAVQEVVKISINQDPLILGYTIFPAILDRLVEDDNFFLEFSKILSQPSQKARGMQISQDFRLTALDYLNSAARRKKLHGNSLKQFVDNLIAIATNEKHVPLATRVRVIRMFVKYKNSQTINALGKILKNKNLLLIDASAHVLSKWNEKNIVLQRQGHEKLVKELFKAADAHPQTYVKLQGVLNAIASSKLPKKVNVLQKLVKAARTTDDWERILGIFHFDVDTSILVECIQEISSKKNQKEIPFDRFISTMLENPKAVGKLFKDGFFKEYLYTTNLLKQLPYRGGIDDLAFLCQEENKDISQFAKQVARSLPGEQMNALLTKGVALTPVPQGDQHFEGRPHIAFYESILGKNKVKQRMSRLPSETKQKLLKTPFKANAFNLLETGSRTVSPSSGTVYRGKSLINKGNVMYKNLSQSIQDLLGGDDHWHAGLYCGFYPLYYSNYSPYVGYFDEYGTGGRMKGIHMNDVIYGIQTFEKYKNFSSPSANLASQMHQLYQELVALFEAGDGFQGHRCPPGLDAETRNAICNTAFSLLGYVPLYTFADMLDYYGAHWTGTPSDIISMRCDGVVEYCYEKNNVKVCSGVNPDFWNIALPHSVYAENHNKLHLGIYSNGDLCPRIQSGERHGNSPANASTFHRITPEIPDVEKFFVTSDLNGVLPPMVYFKFKADQTEKLYVRITVSKDGGPFYFLMADDYLQNGKPYIGTPLGTMKFRKLNPTDYIVWLGRTVNGPDFWGQEGDFEFRIVAVDEGGNVSPTVFYKRKFKIGSVSGWSRPQPVTTRLSETFRYRFN